MQDAEQVVTEVDPRTLSATIEVVDQDGRLLGSGRSTARCAERPLGRPWGLSWSPAMAVSSCRLASSGSSIPPNDSNLYGG